MRPFENSSTPIGTLVPLSHETGIPLPLSPEAVGYHSTQPSSSAPNVQVDGPSKQSFYRRHRHRHPFFAVDLPVPGAQFPISERARLTRSGLIHNEATQPLSLRGGRAGDRLTTISRHGGGYHTRKHILQWQEGSTDFGTHPGQLQGGIKKVKVPDGQTLQVLCPPPLRFSPVLIKADSRSPWCGHCQEFLPTFQTLYEYYYTSKPVGKDADFTGFYDFRFAELNCVAYADLCTENKVAAWPTTILFEDGEPLVTFRGVKHISVLSGAVEDALEKVKPNTRPKTLELPEPGDKTSPDAKAETEKTEKADAREKGSEKELVKETEKEKETETSTAASADASTEGEATPKKTYTVNYNTPSQKVTLKPSNPNPKGLSVPLTWELFQSMVTLTQEPWFVKFYAPWCHHCQAMAPNWEQLAKEMKGRLNIGEVNCDRDTRLCKELRVRGYPSIMFFKGGEKVEYEGLRGLGDFVQYAEKAIDLSSGVPDVDFDSFKALEEKEEVIFLYFYDHATTSEDFLSLERYPLSLIGKAKLVKTRDPKLYDRYKITTWPRLIVSREGRPTYYTPLAPREMRDTRMVLNWMKSVWLPLVPELTPSNARDIMDGKIVVLGVLNRENEDSFRGAIREMKSAANEWMDKQIQLFQIHRQDLRDAKQLRIEEAEDRGDQRALRNAKNIRINMDRSDMKEATFAWVDGNFWQRWIRTTYGIDAKDGDRVIINDEDVSSLISDSCRSDLD